MVTFQKAVKRKSKLRLGIGGVSGAGKTWTALTLAEVMAQGGTVAVIDTEHGSAALYADRFTFDTLEIRGSYHPDRYIEALKAAADAGYSALVIDSLTHAWSGTDGVLDQVEKCSKRMHKPDSFRAWGEAGTPLQNRLVEAILACPMHVICTFRMKQEYIVDKDERGKSTPRKVGIGLQQRDGFEYELSMFAEMDLDHTLIVQKTRCTALADAVIQRPGREMGETILQWLESGAAEEAPRETEPAPEPAPAPARPEAPKVNPAAKALEHFRRWAIGQEELEEAMGMPVEDWNEGTLAKLRDIAKQAQAHHKAADAALSLLAAEKIARDAQEPYYEATTEPLFPDYPPAENAAPAAPVANGVAALLLQYQALGIYREDLEMFWGYPAEAWSEGVLEGARASLERLLQGEEPESVFGGWAPSGYQKPVAA